MPGLKAFVASFLFCDGKVLLLRRREDAVFAPGYWTGVGGKVTAAEFGDLTDAALREIAEETGIQFEQITSFQMRVVLAQPEMGDVVVLAFFEGQTHCQDVVPCDEGDLHWVDPSGLDGLPMIVNAKCALTHILDAPFEEGVRFGVCRSLAPNQLQSLVLASRDWHL